MIVSKKTKWVLFFGVCGALLAAAIPLVDNKSVFVPEPKHLLEYENNYEIVSKNNTIQRMISMDGDVGVYDENKIDKARQFADKWIQHAAITYQAPKEKNFTTMRHYLRELNLDLFDYFYYDNDSMINSLSNQFADCDVYSYLLIDAARMQGVELSLVLAPGHAFVTWDNPNGIDLHWESTKATPADLGTFYRNSLSDFEYRSVSETEITDVILPESYSYNKDKFTPEQKSEIGIKHYESSSAVISKINWLVIAGQLSIDDNFRIGDEYETLLKRYYYEEPRHVFAKQLLAKYLRDNGNLDEANKIINETLTFEKLDYKDLAHYLNNSDVSALKGTLLWGRAVLTLIYEKLAGTTPATKDLLAWLFTIMFTSLLFSIVTFAVITKPSEKEKRESDRDQLVPEKSSA